MSEQHLLAALKTLCFKNMDNDTLEALKFSLNHIIDNDVFTGEMQEEAFVGITKITEALGERSALEAKAALEAAEKNRKKKNWTELLKQHMTETEEPQGNSENDELVRLMIRSERDGTLSFTFRGIRWDFNHMSNTWDYTKDDNK